MKNLQLEYTHSTDRQSYFLSSCRSWKGWVMTSSWAPWPFLMEIWSHGGQAATQIPGLHMTQRWLTYHRHSKIWKYESKFQVSSPIVPMNKGSNALRCQFWRLFTSIYVSTSKYSLLANMIKKNKHCEVLVSCSDWVDFIELHACNLLSKAVISTAYQLYLHIRKNSHFAIANYLFWFWYFSQSKA